MLLEISHKTDLSYSDLISESIMELRMAPRQEEDQHRLSFNLAIGPPTTVTSYFDWLGNAVHAFTVNAFHKEIRIVATSVVETDRQAITFDNLDDGWQPESSAYDYSVYDYLQFQGPVVDHPALRDLASKLAPNNGASMGQITQRILDLIDQKFTYQKGVTNFASPITDVLEHGAGVCQDFTHLMIGLARAMKIPARYVSGFLHPDQEHFRGSTQTHAWCELLFPKSGWVGFDPANKCIVGGNFIKVAVGRDFRDVAPNKGLFRGKATEDINVEVHSRELETIPSEMAAERTQPLPVPVYIGGSPAHRDAMNQQQEQQQQQQTQ